MSEIVPNLDARELCEPYEHLIRQALAHSGGTHWYEDILYEVQKGNMFFWPAEKSCMITHRGGAVTKKTNLPCLLSRW
jgi:hypothetical protein